MTISDDSASGNLMSVWEILVLSPVIQIEYFLSGHLLKLLQADSLDL